MAKSRRPITVGKSFSFSARSIAIEASASDGKLPTFTINAYNGGPLRVDGYDLPIVVDISGVRVERDVVANLHHDRRQIVGHVSPENVKLGQSSIDMEGVISGTGPAAEEAVSNHRNGFPWQASIEATPEAGAVEYVDEGEKVTVNGQEFAGPLLVSRRSKLHGIAFVARGADDTTSISIAASAAKTVGASAMNFEQWCADCGIDPASLDEAQKQKLMTAFDAHAKTVAASTPPVDDPSKKDIPVAASIYDPTEIIAAHSEQLVELDDRIDAHRESVDPAKFSEVKKSALKAVRDIKASAIKGKWDATKFNLEVAKAINAAELALVKAAAPAGDRGPAIHAGAKDLDDKSMCKVIEAAMCRSLGQRNVEKQFDEKILDAADAYRNMGLHQMLIMAAARNGYRSRPGEGIHRGNIEDVLRYAMPPKTIQASGNSSFSVSGILSNVANKEILQGFESESKEWQEIAAIKSCKDFKTVTSYRLNDNMEYEKLAPDGTIRHGKISEESYTRSVDTYAKMFALTRQQIINDDMDAFSDLKNRLGAGSAIKLNNLFWTTFLAAVSAGTFFTAGRGNYITGSTTTLLNDAVGLALAVKAFRQLKTPTVEGSAGRLLNNKPEILLISENQEVPADQLYTSTNFNTGGSSTKDLVANNNIYKGKYRPVLVPQLADTANFTGASTTHWGLFCNPSKLAPATVSFLNGQQSPTVDQTEADFDTLGIQMRGYHDFGVDMAEYLAGVWSKGAA